MYLNSLTWKFFKFYVASLDSSCDLVQRGPSRKTDGMYYLRAKNTQPAFPVSLNRIKYSTYSSLKTTAMQSRQSANLIRKDKSSNEITVQGCIHAITGNFQVRTMMQREWRPFSKNALCISLTWLKKVSLAWSDSHSTWFLFGTLKDLVGVLMLANVELSYTWPLHINPF